MMMMMMMMKVKSGEINLIWGNVNKENFFIFVCMLSIIIFKCESFNVFMLISFLILFGVLFLILICFFNSDICINK